MSSLSVDSVLLRRFIEWATGNRAPSSQLAVVEQTLPGEEEPIDEDEAERRGLPDGWIYNDNGWALLIESKIESPLTLDQLERHRRTASRRGFTHIHTLALVAETRKLDSFNSADLTIRKWAQLYQWLKQERSEWASRLTAYMEVLEGKLVRDECLREGVLTVFSGIPFGNETPYNYMEAKRLLRLAMEELRKRHDLKRDLGMDPNAKGRSAITGIDDTKIWDFLRLAGAQEADNFTEFPHLTFSIHQDRLFVIVTVPNGIRPEFRRNLLADDTHGLRDVLERVLRNLNASLTGVKGAAPWIEVIQRRYPTQRSDPIIDARLEFDLRTGFEAAKSKQPNVKQQPQWLDAAYRSLANKNSNLQLGVGAIFRYGECEIINTPEILDRVAKVWISCKPLLQTMFGTKANAAGAK